VSMSDAGTGEEH